ncbi:MAG: peptide chain release factor N(5)-glutamine methyltransferase [Planctomycetales bacterium]|nr:peptide chain release factor N(5)-glutamine methyltransferase [Planctomycetales bacterium]
MATDSEAWTVGRLLKWTADYLKDRGAEQPRLDAEVLLAHVRKCQRIELYTCFDDVADESTRNEFRELVRRRAQGEPVAYLVGHREFYSRDFRVTRDVLIPRPETEFIIVALQDLAKQSGEPQRAWDIIDIGTGSGVLAICAAALLPTANVWAVDCSLAALEVARENAAAHGVADRITFLTSDLLAGVPAEQMFDFIVSNPPYIAESERAELPRDVIDHEPHIALFSGPDGLDALKQLIAAAAARLRPGGWLLYEFSPPQERALVQEIARHPELVAATSVPDLSRRPRVLRAQHR